MPVERSFDRPAAPRSTHPKHTLSHTRCRNGLARGRPARDSTSSHRARQPAQDQSTPVCVRRTILLANSTDVTRGCTLTCAATAARHTTFHLLCLRQRTERASQGSTSLRPNIISQNMQNRAALEGSMVKCLVGNLLCACVLTSTGVQLQNGAW